MPTSSSSSSLPYYLSFNNVLGHSSYARCKQSTEPSFVFLYVGYFFLPWLYAIFRFSHYRRNWAHPPTAPHFKDFSAYLTYFSNVSKLQHQENTSNWKDSLCGCGVTENLLSVIKEEMQSSVYSASEWNVPHSEDSDLAIYYSTI